MHKQLLSWTLIRFGEEGEPEEGERFPGVVKARVAISAEATSRFALWARARGLLRVLQGRRNASPAQMPPRGRIPARSTSNIFYFFHLDFFNRARADENNWTMNG